VTRAAQDPFGGPRAALAGGLREALGLPVFVLAASYVGFGALAQQGGIGLWLALASTPAIWALPGQVILVEMLALRAEWLAVVAGVALSAARFLPMTLALLPYLREGKPASWRLYAAAQLVAVTGWAAAMRRCPHVPPDERLPYFAGFTVPLVCGAAVGTAAGFTLADAMPRDVMLALVFVNPVYFMLVFVGDVRQRPAVLALAIGAAAGPWAHALTPSWSLLLTGLVGGTAAFLLDRAWPARSPRTGSGGDP
jgi:predicted branched-subunit amino acid permease